MRSLLHALPAALLSVLGGTSGAASQIQPAVVESFAHSALLSVRVIDGEPNDAGDHEAMAVVVSTITEMVRVGCAWMDMDCPYHQDPVSVWIKSKIFVCDRQSLPSARVRGIDVMDNPYISVHRHPSTSRSVFEELSSARCTIFKR